MKKHMSMAFLDIKKAYDKVNRKVLWETLRKIGCNGKFINILQALYSDCEAQIRWGDIITNPFKVTVELKQGCVVSPKLFALYIKEHEDDLVQSGIGVKIGDGTIRGLFFADNMVPFAESEKDLQKLLNMCVCIFISL